MIPSVSSAVSFLLNEKRRVLIECVLSSKFHADGGVFFVMIRLNHIIRLFGLVGDRVQFIFRHILRSSSSMIINFLIESTQMR